jgi:hypothetical protein
MSTCSGLAQTTHAALGRRSGASQYGTFSRREHGNPEVLVAVEFAIVCQHDPAADPAPSARAETAAKDAAADQIDGLPRGEHAGLLEADPLELTGISVGKNRHHGTSMPNLTDPCGLGCG